MSTTRSDGGSVVIPAVHAPHAVTCLRSLGRRGIHTIAAYERRTPAFSSRYCDEIAITPSPTENLAGYRDALLSLVRRPDVRAIVPMREADVYVLAKYRAEFEAEVTPLWPSFDAVRTAHDRVRLVEAAERAGVPAPETRPLDDVDEWDGRQIVKPRFACLTADYLESYPSQRCVEPSSVHYLDRGVEPDSEAICEAMGHVPIVQEYVPGEEYALWALYDEGTPVATCHKHQVRGFSYAGGTSVYRETIREPALEAVGRALLEELDWHGFASVQMKRDPNTGEFKLMEINPRVWVSVACPVRAGIDFPYHYWQLANGERIDESPDYRLGTATHRIGGEVLYLRSVVGSDDSFVEPPRLRSALWDVASSLYEQPSYDYLSLDDPRPFGRDILNWLQRFAR
ncbi:ATP-grasp domain-containing protein (plasmid) [Haloferacaceae archaeon DSL9]